MQPHDSRESLQADQRGHSVNGWLVLILISLVVVLLYRDWQRQKIADRTVAARGDLAEDEKSTIELFKKISPSVVHVTNLAERVDRRSLNVLEIPQGVGSGFVWSDDGYIVTNFHVIKGADSAEVTLSDNTSLKAQLVGWDDTKDIAVLRVNTTPGKLIPIPVGTSADLQVGQKVFAIGSPFELDQTLTTGVIGGLGREIDSVSGRPIQGVIQTDAAINPGNSGGPLLDSSGRLIGINTAIAGRTGNSVGIGFAVPVDTVSRIVPQLIRDGKVTRPGLGITTFEDSWAQPRGIVGVVIRQIVPGGAADKAGLQPTTQQQLGDVLIGIDGHAIQNHNDLYRAIDQRQVGDLVKLRVIRNGKPIETEATLQSISSGTSPP